MTSKPSSEVVSIQCPRCEASFRIDAKFVGRKVKCSKCQHDFRAKQSSASPKQANVTASVKGVDSRTIPRSIPSEKSSTTNQTATTQANQKAAKDESKNSFTVWYNHGLGKKPILIQILAWIICGYIWIPCWWFFHRGWNVVAVGMGILGILFLVIQAPSFPKTGNKKTTESVKTNSGSSSYRLNGSSKHKGPIADDSLVRVMAKDFVKENLRFPEEARFPYMPVPVVVSHKEKIPLFYVFGEVTGKNAFGVKKKLRWGALIKHDQVKRSSDLYHKEHWSCYKIIMDGSSMSVDPIPNEYIGDAGILILMYTQIFKK